MKHATRIQEAEAAYTLWWSDIASEAAAEGVEVRPGEAYGIKAVSNAWGELRRAGLVEQARAGKPAVPAQQVAPAPVISPAPVQAGQASKRLQPSATAMPPRRRFGGEN